METHCYAGFTVSPYYDPLLAKLIVVGKDREEAVQKLQAALEEFHVGGISTNIPFLRRLVVEPQWLANDFSTSFVPGLFEAAYAG
jgi:acetyl-CoA carboxylase biotin carboxylase subunit